MRKVSGHEMTSVSYWPSEWQNKTNGRSGSTGQWSHFASWKNPSSPTVLTTQRLHHRLKVSKGKREQLFRNKEIVMSHKTMTHCACCRATLILRRKWSREQWRGARTQYTWPRSFYSHSTHDHSSTVHMITEVQMNTVLLVMTYTKVQWLTVKSTHHFLFFFRFFFFHEKLTWQKCEKWLSFFVCKK